MNKKTQHKFQEKMELTYEQYFHTRYERMVQLGRELERVLGREKAFKIIGKACDRFAVELIKKKTAERGRPIKNFEDFKTFAKEEQRSTLFSHFATFTYPEETSKKWVIRTTECLIAKTFKEMNATDLGQIMCNTDFAAAQAYHPKLKLLMTKSLMKGDEYCESTYHWEE